MLEFNSSIRELGDIVYPSLGCCRSIGKSHAKLFASFAIGRVRAASPSAPTAHAALPLCAKREREAASGQPTILKSPLSLSARNFKLSLIPGRFTPSAGQIKNLLRKTGAGRSRKGSDASASNDTAFIAKDIGPLERRLQQPHSVGGVEKSLWISKKSSRKRRRRRESLELLHQRGH